MSETHTITLVLGIIAAINLSLLIACFVYIRKNNRHQARMSEQTLQKTDRSLKILSHEIEEVSSNSIGMGQTIKQLEQSLVQLHERQVELELQDPESKLYNKASKMAAKGASLQDIVEECEISNAEAQLILSLKKKR